MLAQFGTTFMIAGVYPLTFKDTLKSLIEHRYSVGKQGELHIEDGRTDTVEFLYNYDLDLSANVRTALAQLAPEYSV